METALGVWEVGPGSFHLMTHFLRSCHKQLTAVKVPRGSPQCKSTPDPGQRGGGQREQTCTGDGVSQVHDQLTGNFFIFFGVQFDLC